MACTHDDQDMCECRKPKPGLILSVIKKYALESKRCCMIGDSYKDIFSAKNAKIDSFFYKTTYNETQIQKFSLDMDGVCVFESFNELESIL